MLIFNTLINSSITLIAQNIAVFDDLNLSTDSFWNGNDNSGGFTSGGIYFSNSYTDYGGGMFSWYGFAYSNKKDTLTQGYSNQFSAITGKGVFNSDIYGISYVYFDWMNNYKMIPNIIKFPNPSTIRGFYLTNNTYTYYSMLNGDGVLAKKFGGNTGNDPDWFKLQIKGFLNGIVKDSIDFYLADFRFQNNTLDYIVNKWEWVDLSTLGNVDSLSFGLSSSDNGMYGMNTPAYFCIDNFNDQKPNNVSNLILNENILQIYPNPCSNYLKININFTSENSFKTLKILNMKGIEIMYIDKLDKNTMIDLSYLISGVYIININIDKSNFYQKIIKK